MHDFIIVVCSNIRRFYIFFPISFFRAETDNQVASPGLNQSGPGRNTVGSVLISWLNIDMMFIDPTEKLICRYESQGWSTVKALSNILKFAMSHSWLQRAYIYGCMDVCCMYRTNPCCVHYRCSRHFRLIRKGKPMSIQVPFSDIYFLFPSFHIDFFFAI